MGQNQRYIHTVSADPTMNYNTNIYTLKRILITLFQVMYAFLKLVEEYEYSSFFIQFPLLLFSTDHFNANRLTISTIKD